MPARRWRLPRANLSNRASRPRPRRRAAGDLRCPEHNHGGRRAVLGQRPPRPGVGLRRGPPRLPIAVTPLPRLRLSPILPRTTPRRTQAPDWLTCLRINTLREWAAPLAWIEMFLRLSGSMCLACPRGEQPLGFEPRAPMASRRPVHAEPPRFSLPLEGTEENACQRYRPNASTARFVAPLSQNSFKGSARTEGSVIRGTVVAIENNVAVIDIGPEVREGRVALKEFSGPAAIRPSRSATEWRSISSASRTEALGEAVISRDKARRDIQAQVPVGEIEVGFAPRSTPGTSRSGTPGRHTGGIDAELLGCSRRARINLEVIAMGPNDRLPRSMAYAHLAGTSASTPRTIRASRYAPSTAYIRRPIGPTSPSSTLHQECIDCDACVEAARSGPAALPRTSRPTSAELHPDQRRLLQTGR